MRGGVERAARPGGRGTTFGGRAALLNYSCTHTYTHCLTLMLLLSFGMSNWVKGVGEMSGAAAALRRGLSRAALQSSAPWMPSLLILVVQSSLTWPTRWRAPRHRAASRCGGSLSAAGTTRLSAPAHIHSFAPSAKEVRRLVGMRPRQQDHHRHRCPAAAPLPLIHTLLPSICSLWHRLRGH